MCTHVHIPGLPSLSRLDLWNVTLVPALSSKRASPAVAGLRRGKPFTSNHAAES
jgi:hypothetical protein